MSIDCPDAVTVVVDGHGDPGGASGVAFANVGGETHSAASVTHGVLEQVGQDLLHQAGIDEQQGQIRIERHLECDVERGLVEQSTQPKGATVDDLIEFDDLDLWDECAGFDSTEAEQVADEAIEALGLGNDEIEQIVPSRRIEHHARPKIRRHPSDRDKWGPKVVGHGSQQCRPLSTNRLEHGDPLGFGRQPFSFARDLDQLTIDPRHLDLAHFRCTSAIRFARHERADNGGDDDENHVCEDIFGVSDLQRESRRYEDHVEGQCGRECDDDRRPASTDYGRQHNRHEEEQRRCRQRKAVVDEPEGDDDGENGPAPGGQGAQPSRLSNRGHIHIFVHRRTPPTHRPNGPRRLPASRDISSQFVLVVHEDLNLLDNIRAALSEDAIECRTVSTVAAAFEAIQLRMPDTVILGLDQFGDCSIELCRRIRTQTRTPVVAVSTVHSPQFTVRALDVGADDLIEAPFLRRFIDEPDMRYTMDVRCSSKGINDAIAKIPDDAWEPIEYTNDGQAEVAECAYTTGTGKRAVTRRLVVRRRSVSADRFILWYESCYGCDEVVGERRGGSCRPSRISCRRSQLEWLCGSSCRA